jgi:hypothetical protein
MTSRSKGGGGGESGLDLAAKCDAYVRLHVHNVVFCVTREGGGEGVKNCQNLHDVIYERPLTSYQVTAS